MNRVYVGQSLLGLFRLVFSEAGDVRFGTWPISGLFVCHVGRVLECGFVGSFSHGPQLGSCGLIDSLVASLEAGVGASILFCCAGTAFG